MNLVSTKELLLDAQRKHYAVPAFNVENMETIQGVVIAAQELRHPVIIQTTPSSAAYAGLDYMAANMRAAMKESDITAALHLDHGSSLELVVRSIRAGYTSVMIDGSALSFEENIALTKKAAESARVSGVSVEAELGCIGGKEEETVSSTAIYTDAEEAAVFVRETDVDSLAVAIGTAHGFYQGIPHIDLERLAEIRSKVTIPLVLHGTSGVPDEVVCKCIEGGICKVNYATDLRQAFTAAVRNSLVKNPEQVDPKIYLKAGRDAVAEAALHRIKLCMNRL